MKRYIVTIDDEKVGYSKKKKVANKFVNGYYASNRSVICNVVKSTEIDEFIKNPDNEIIPVGRIYLPRRYEEAYLIDFCGSEFQVLMREVEEMLLSRFTSKKDKKRLINEVMALSEVASEEDLYVPSIVSLQASSERITEWRYLCGNY